MIIKGPGARLQHRTCTCVVKEGARQLWQTSSKSTQQIAADLEIAHGLLYRWLGDALQAGAIAIPGDWQVHAGDAELHLLRQGLAEIRGELVINKKTGADGGTFIAVISSNKCNTKINTFTARF